MASGAANKTPLATLNDGVLMPLLGFGTSDIKGTGQPGDPAYESIKTAIKSGYRFIDSAALYGNEHSTGAAIKDAISAQLVAREQLFICTKVWCTAHKRRSVVAACRESLRKLQLDYIDLYLIHWPVAYVECGDPVNPLDATTGKLLYSDTHYTETWLGMEDCKDLGLARSIGVSNFNHKMIDDILAMPCKHKPTVNQMECHPYMQLNKLHNYCTQAGIVLNAYCPLGSPGSSWLPKGAPNVIEDKLINRLAAGHGKSPAQVCLRYLIQRGIAPIPKSVTTKRILENIDLFDFELSEQEMQEISKLDKNLRYCNFTAGHCLKDHPLYPFHIEY